MANTLVQFRADEAEKTQGALICNQLGFDLSTYFRICLSRLVQERGIPFSVKLDDEDDNKGVMAMKRASKIAQENNISDMSLDEINAEINATRKGD